MVWQNVMQRLESKKYMAVGSFAYVGSYNAHCYTKGKGDSTIIFVTGSGTPCAYTDFYYLQNELSKYTKTISYDHAGFGWSSSTDIPRTIDNLTTELSNIIGINAYQSENIIIVCHSLGSLEAIRFTQENPDRVAGIVFLDGGSPEFYSKEFEVVSKVMNRSSAILRIFGITRLLGEFSLLLPLYGENVRNKALPDFIRSTDKAMYYHYFGNSANVANIELINENANTVLGNGSLGNIPILVLSSDSSEAWQNVQKQLAEWSSSSKHITVKNSQHYIHWSNTDEVIKYINMFIKNVKDNYPE
jgi:pimeloyl-ACP methyl ester carboxylesterase